ncbi:ArsR/SmtB family transcription factor [Pseudorhodoferax soli]|uniref:ArsR family transcriptional regulator n=1 Tax=Pseudorhodoferax soli TaxID=545864 RepID=A0A368Y2Y7_9BURK|nr:metalloregulator ArsR/SmtB family transcription factor [Pseudorhodoferax soli]RCW74552.1 ArsR family transcriptional regulator [Pseudorhodoferax soli]
MRRAPTTSETPAAQGDAGAGDMASARVFERAAELFALLGTPLRLRILQRLCRSEMNVGELRAALGSARSSVSQHLATLHRCGVLTRQRKGAQVFYAVHPVHGGLLCEAVRRMVDGGAGT